MYLTIKKVIYNQIDYNLIIEKTIIEDQIELTDNIPDFEGFTLVIRLRSNYSIIRYVNFQSIKDTDIYDSKSDSFTPFRYIFSSGNTTQKKGFIITIFKVTAEKNELLQAIGIISVFPVLFTFLHFNSY